MVPPGTGLARVRHTAATGSAPVLRVPVIDGALREYAASPGIRVYAEFALHRQQLPKETRYPPINQPGTPVLQDGFGSLMTRRMALLRDSRVKNANKDGYSLRFVTDSADFTVCTENARRKDHAEIPTCTGGIYGCWKFSRPSKWDTRRHGTNKLTRSRNSVSQSNLCARSQNILSVNAGIIVAERDLGWMCIYPRHVAQDCRE